jgi:WD40 repeat protein
MTPTTHTLHRAPRWTGWFPIAVIVGAIVVFVCLGEGSGAVPASAPPRVTIPRVAASSSPVAAAATPMVCEECSGFAGGPRTTLVGMLGAYAPKSGIGGIESVAFSPDNRVLVAGARNGVLCAWDVVERRALWRSERFVGGIASVSFTRDGRSVLVGGHDGSVSEWNATTGARTRMFYPRDIDGWWDQPKIGVTPDGQRAFSADGVAERVVIWDLASGVEIDRITGKAIAGWPAFALDPTGTKFATGTKYSETIDLWDTSTKKARRLVDGPESLEGSARGAAFSPDGKLLATGHWNGVIRLWDVERARAGDSWHPHKGVIWQLAFAPDGRLVSGVDREPVSVWNVATMKRELAVEPEGARALAVSGDGKLLATGSFSGWVRVWNMTDGSLAWDLGSDAPGVSALDVTENGTKAVLARPDGSAEMWIGGARTAALAAVQGARAFAVNAATSRVLVEARGGRLLLRDLDEGSATRVLRDKLTDREREHFVPSVAISPDGRMALEGRIDGRVMLWDLDAGTVLATWRDHVQSVAALAFSPDGTHAVTGETGMKRIDDPSRPLIVWDVAQRKKVKELPHNGDVFTVAYAADGQHAVVGRFGAASYWDVGAGTARWGHGKPTDLVIHHVLPLSDVAISQDGRFAASAGADYKLNLFDVATGELIDQRVTMSADDAPTQIAFSGGKLFVGTRRGVVLIFALRDTAQAVVDSGTAAGEREERSANTGPDEDCALTCIAPEACVRYYGGMAECLPLCERDADCPAHQVCVCEGSGLCTSHSTRFVCEDAGRRDEAFGSVDQTAAHKAKRIADVAAAEAARRLERGNSDVNTTHENGNAREKGQYSLGLESGAWTKWYDDGTKRAEGAFASGRRTGVWRGYYKNGQLWFEGEYRDGTMEGRWRSWHRNGKLAAEGRYTDGKRVGPWQLYRDDGGLVVSAGE